MKAFLKHEGILIPLDRSNIDTDQIIPKQFLKRCERSGFGEHLFHDWRYREDAEGPVTPDPDFVLNQHRYRGGSILLAGENFGCGSSREHAVWALCQYGFRAIFAPSFADIFFVNAIQNGLLPAILPSRTIDKLLDYGKSAPRAIVEIDVERREIGLQTGESLSFSMDAGIYRRWVSAAKTGTSSEAQDPIGKTLQYEGLIREFEKTVQA